ncbi:MAG: hypothetical protein MOB07_16525 [Acidobacteria bacterium]|nr:hypothetical protein [Acidobacteriota bacterium]
MSAQTASQLASRAADLVIEHHREKRAYPRDAVRLLCEITADEDPEIARAGLSALFPALVERLNDSFDPEACSIYDQVIAQVIDFYRRLPGGEKLDEGLRRFGLLNEADLLDRKSNISNLQFQISNLKSVRSVLLLSRVTIGADVAVTSVIIAKLREVLPDAEFVLLGSRKLRDLYGGDSRLRIREIAYERGGNVLSRLTSWLDVVEAVDNEKRELKPEEFLLIDPDSRLTQLGLLPLLKDERGYFFFESRSYRRPGASRLGELASHWVSEVFGVKSPAFPYVALPPEHQIFGQSIAEKLRRAGASHLVTVSLGVGGNPSKRISDSFEEKLIHHLLNDSTLILDKGASDEEREQINRITAKLRAQGKTIVEINEQNAAEWLKQETICADVLTWDGGIGAFAALTAASEEYIGYDSAGQHIAAALGVPALTIFVNSNSKAFAERWQPYGAGIIEVLNLGAEDLVAKPEREGSVLTQSLTLIRQLRLKV